MAEVPGLSALPHFKSMIRVGLTKRVVFSGVVRRRTTEVRRRRATTFALLAGKQRVSPISESFQMSAGRHEGKHRHLKKGGPVLAPRGATIAVALSCFISASLLELAIPVGWGLISSAVAKQDKGGKEEWRWK